MITGSIIIIIKNQFVSDKEIIVLLWVFCVLGLNSTLQSFVMNNIFLTLCSTLQSFVMRIFFSRCAVCLCEAEGSGKNGYEYEWVRVMS